MDIILHIYHFILSLNYNIYLNIFYYIYIHLNLINNQLDMIVYINMVFIQLYNINILLDIQLQQYFYFIHHYSNILHL